jgi:hypothetical protein
MRCRTEKGVLKEGVRKKGGVGQRPRESKEFLDPPTVSEYVGRGDSGRIIS